MTHLNNSVIMFSIRCFIDGLDRTLHKEVMLNSLFIVSQIGAPHKPMAYTDGRLNAIGGYVKNWSNEDLLDQLITRANQVGVISESNDIRGLREVVLLRMSNGMANNKFDLTTPTDCSNAFGCPHFINGKPSF